MGFGEEDNVDLPENIQELNGLNVFDCNWFKLNQFSEKNTKTQENLRLLIYALHSTTMIIPNIYVLGVKKYSVIVINV